MDTLRTNRLYRLHDLAELPDGSIVAWVDRGVFLELRTGAKMSAFGRNCEGCHAPTFGVPAGPSQVGLIGREIATVPGFSYSPAQTALGGAWDEARLDAFLRAPKQLHPGNRWFCPI